MSRVGMPSLRGRLSKKAVALLLVALAILLSAVTVFVLIFSARSPRQSRYGRYAALPDSVGESTVFYDGERALALAQGNLSSYEVSFGSAMEVALTEEGALCLLSGERATVLAEHVCEFLLSAEGTGVLYLTEQGALMLAYADGRTVCLEESGVPTLSGAAVSPRAGAVSYPLFGQEEQTLVLWQSGERTCLTGLYSKEDVRVLAVDDRGQSLYYLTAEGTALYHADRHGKSQKITSSFCAEHGDVWFDRTLGELLFSESNGCTYAWTLSSGKERISSGVARPVLAGGERAFACAGGTGLATVFSEPSLRDRLYLVSREESRNLRYLDSAWSSSKIASDVWEAFADETGTGAYFARRTEDSFRLYYVDAEGEERAEVLIASGVKSYELSESHGSICYITRTGKLYLRADGEDTLLSENADSAFFAADGQVLFTLTADSGAMHLFVSGEQGPRRLASGVLEIELRQGGVYLCLKQDGVRRWHLWQSDSLLSLS